MKLVWSKADARRAEKMDWAFNGQKIIAQYGGRFFANHKGENYKTMADREAAEWVIEMACGWETWLESKCQLVGKPTPDNLTARKAVLLCCIGGTK